MKLLLLIGGWFSVGLLVGSRAGARPAWERLLAVAFWPFFLAAFVADSPAAEPASEAAPVARLRAALSPDDPAQALVNDLSGALTRQQARVARLDGALAAAATSVGDDPALSAARQRSRELLAAARQHEGRALGEALAAIEEAATRLWLLREGGERGEVEALLSGLAARLRASEEVDGEGRAALGKAAPPSAG